ncbi:MAG: thioredoxin family protein, partial [Acidobacteriota bacterium]
QEATASDDIETEEPVQEETEEKKPPSLLGEVTRSQIESAEPGWVAAQVEAEVDAGAALELSAVEGGDVSVTVYLGTWCDDSRDELARFWRALDDAGYFDVDVKYLAVDRSDKRPPELADDLQIFWVPTFIVERGGEEVGRVVESSRGAIERDLLDLLRGDASGVLTGREDGAVPPADDDEAGG